MKFSDKNKGKGKFIDRTGDIAWGRGPEPMGRFERKAGKGDGSILEARFRDKKSEGLSDTWRRMGRSIRKDGK